MSAHLEPEHRGAGTDDVQRRRWHSHDDRPAAATAARWKRAARCEQRWNWRRLGVFGNLALGRSLNAPRRLQHPRHRAAGRRLGTGSGDVHQRFNVGISGSQLRNLNANININVSSAPPYTIRTGTDDNGDLVFNDRPFDVGRNTVRATGQWTINGFFNYGWTFGKPVERPGGISLRNDGGGLAVSQAAAQSAGRYRLSVTVNVQNLTNHGNLTGYTATRTSINWEADHVPGTSRYRLGLSF